jgi:hypothetical protein
MEHRILSAIPKQMTDVDEKLDWLRNVCHSYHPHIIVTPQEFFGGAVMMLHKRDFTHKELFPSLSKICKENNVAMAVGVQERDDDGSNRTAIWFINEKGKYLGRLLKFALPRYDHINAKGFGQVSPETAFENRFKVFKLHELYVTSIFCWEVYSDILWTGLGLIKPDVVFSQIKFGPNAWPQLTTIKSKKTVTGFGYGRWADKTDDGGWIERLRMGNVWQVKCPVICSTNSWNLNPRSMPICGTISGIDGQAVDDHWYPRKDDKLKEIPEKIIVSTIDEQRIRGSLKNKFAYQKAVGEFPPFSIGRFTMHLKINRIEDRLLRDLEKESKSNKLF